MFVLIGAPVYDRAWILPDWFRCIEKQDIDLSNVGFVFEGGTNDQLTVESLMDFHMRHPELRCFDIQVNERIQHEAHEEGRRVWVPERYSVMAKMRNDLLERATSLAPDRYFSLDTDILLENPTTISQLIELTNTHDAVSPLAFMTPEGVFFPNIMNWVDGPSGRARRLKPHEYAYGELFESDVIMATVMMSPAVYQNARYQWHRQGEDLGWSSDCALRGFRLHLASYLYTPHIMSRAALVKYKEVGDGRGQECQNGFNAAFL